MNDQFSFPERDRCFCVWHHVHTAVGPTHLRVQTMQWQKAVETPSPHVPTRHRVGVGVELKLLSFLTLALDGEL
jgi:hypothetical protein